jgi:hypothetical protein
MTRYLGSGLVKGIGLVDAERIVDAFGETTFSVIARPPTGQCGGHHPAHA